MQGFLVIGAAIALIAAFLIANRQPDQRVAFPKTAALSTSPTVIPDWRLAVENQLINPATAFPTEYVPPTLTPTHTPIPSPTIPVEIVGVGEVEQTPLPTLTAGPTGLPVPTVEFRGSTPVPRPTGLAAAAADDSAVAQFQPPAEEIPLSLQPYDHFYMRRPVNASANGESLFYYPYGSGGEVFRIHHGIDIPNPEGELVLAAADGAVVWSGRSLQDTKEGTLEVYASYGNMIVIQHNFYINNQPVYSLYAHMSELIAQAGDQVSMGDVIGRVGTTGYVTGAHVHFEVRVGVNDYWHTRNPLLWIAPYLNHGVIAGRVTDREGNYIESALIQINRGGRRVDSTTSYLRPPQPDVRTIAHSIPDDNWQENFVLGDVAIGEYEIVVVVDGRRYSQTINVRSGMVNFVEFQIDPPDVEGVPIEGEIQQ